MQYTAMVERREIELAKTVIKKCSLQEKILRDDFKKALVREGLSASSADNYIFVLKAHELVEEQSPFLILSKKLFGGGAND